MSFSAADQREMLAALHRLAAEREAAERTTLSDFDVANLRARRELSDTRQAAILRFQMDRDTAQREYDATLARIHSEYATGHATAEKQLQQVLETAHAEFSAADRQVQNQLTEQTWEINTVFEATQGGPQLQLQQDETQIAMIGDTLQQIQDQADGLLSACRLGHVQSDALPRVQASPFGPEDPNARLNRRLQEAANQLHALKSLVLPRMLRGATPLGIALVVWIGICGLTYLMISKYSSSWLIVGTVIALSIIIAGGVWVIAAAGAVAGQPYRAMQAAIAEARELRRLALEQARHRSAAEAWRIVQRRDSELRTTQQRFDSQIAEITARRDAAIAEARETYNNAQSQRTPKRDEALAEAHSVYPKRLNEIQERYQAELRSAQDRFDTATADARRRHDEAWSALTSAWSEGCGKIRAATEENRQVDARLFPPWVDPQWNTWSPPGALPPAIHFGKIAVDLNNVAGAISANPQLNGLIPAQFALPAVLPFPHNASVLWSASGPGRQRAIESVQALMLRMLTAIPPGKVRFTIVDPVGLGENFAAFMHLADHDEQLVTSRIWTEPQQIEQRLADLTEQMENVIQKYLRNEFRSIDEYNAFAGEVAEPFRVLVVANFPVNFTEAAARRLISIATTGARCGVFTLIVHDVNQPLPPHFDLEELRRCAVTLEWDGQQFQWNDADYQKHPLQLEKPPAEELVTRLLQAVGRQAKESKRVEVPFDFVAPQREAWWTADTSQGIRVPLGRFGATKRQYLKLGEGTSQHALIAGKTGSGKSTLLHALITNAALLYGPDQLELYLIDFKKGVEFKTYATHQLPHARVIAIESEREFGLSVLEKLDAELRRRGELFREAGVQDLAAYRQAAGPRSMPRILLIIDEFQEFFTDDDKLAQDASLLLDRLVRQGRAFGMHVLLGSQTLGGAYSLARSTIGQMAVRIALQCSEADAHLILSEENAAARLLSRPGEAIYNDDNGLVQGNHPFQVVWLSEQRREHYLQSLQKLAEERFSSSDSSAPARPTAPIVFEGNLPSEIERCRPLADLLRAPDWPVQSTPVHAWLGEAIAIKDPTAAVFRPQSGANLLVVGQREAGAMGILAASLVSIAAQHRPAAGARGARKSSGYSAGSVARFYVLQHDRPADLPIDRPLDDYRSGLSAFSTLLPHALSSASRRDLPPLIAEVAAEVQRRHSEDDRRNPAIYLCICDLGRFRDLRRDEGELGFSSSRGDQAASAAQMLSLILRDGPAVGVYTIAWCDSLTAVNRAFDRHALREFALRVLMQMSANDSSYLIDTPLASKLGPNAAIFHNEEEGRLEKFRPYAWPGRDWLTEVRERFQSRVAENV